MPHDRVPVAPLREAILERGLSSTDIAMRLGWYRPDTQRVRRRLGLSKHRSGTNGRDYVHENIGYDTAVAICRAADIDPVEVGL